MASLEPALNRQSRVALTAFKAALGATLNRLGTATARRSKHARVVALRVRDALAETCEVATGLAAVNGGGSSGSGMGGLGSGLGSGGGNSSMEKAKAKVTQRIKQLKSRLWLTLHASRHAITRGTWEACLTQVAKRLEGALTAHYREHRAKLARAEEAGEEASSGGGGGDGNKMMDESSSDSNSSNLSAAGAAQGALLTPAATSVVAAVPPTEVESSSSSSSSSSPAGPLPIPKGLFRAPREGEAQRLTVPLLVRRRLKPGDLVKVLWSEESDENNESSTPGGGGGAGGAVEGAGDGGTSSGGAANTSGPASTAAGSYKRPSAESDSNDEAGPGGSLPPLDDPNWCVHLRSFVSCLLIELGMIG
jgi:hypothetical protein